MNVTQLPDALRGKVFSRAEAMEYGMSARTLRGPRIVSVWPGHYSFADTPPDEAAFVTACMAAAPADAALSHTSALRLRGLSLAPALPVHLATNTGRHLRRRHLIVHRFEGPLDVERLHGLPLLGAARTFVDCGTVLPLPQLVAVGDWIVGQALASPSTLRDFAETAHFDGVQKARVAAELVRAGVESVRESVARVHLVANGLPEPAVNADIRSDAGRFLGRGDLSFRQWRVLAEYDGWYHERSAHQRQNDILRRERLEADGWLVVVLTSHDIADPRRAVWRVFNALRLRGYDGPQPRLDPRFGRWMPL